MAIDSDRPVNIRVVSASHGPPTIAVVFDPEKRIPVLPRVVATEVVAAADGSKPWLSQFGLPFGLIAMATVEPYVPPGPPVAQAEPPKTKVTLNGPVFSGADKYVATTQVRFQASGSGAPGGATDPSRSMTGNLRQTLNVVNPATGVAEVSVLPPAVADKVNSDFLSELPLHHADWSGYGLSTFSHWLKAIPVGEIEPTGVTQVRFDVPVGRTSYEMIQLYSRLWHPQARVTRTIVIERGNNANVYRYDTGWVAIEDGECQRYAPIETGVVKRYRNIRNIRILPKPLIEPGGLWKWQEVLYDADLHLIPDPGGQPAGFTVPIRDHTGYIQVEPNEIPRNPEMLALMTAIGHPIGGPIDAGVRLHGTLAMQLSQLEVAIAPNFPVATPQFMLAVSGAPVLPRAGQWNAVAIDGVTKDVSPVDPRRGLPVIHRHYDRGLIFRDPGNAYLDNATEYGLLLSTSSARVLFPKPQVNPLFPGKVPTAAPQIADPTALSMASGMFPRLPFTLTCNETTAFTIDAADTWKLDRQQFGYTGNPNPVAKGAGWLVERQLPSGLRQALIDIDAARAARPWQLGLVQPDELKLKIDPFGEILTIKSAFKAVSGAVPGFEKPTITLGNKLDALKSVLRSLERFVDLGFNVDVDVSAGNGPTPSFLVQLAMRLRLPQTPGTRVDIGIGKLRGNFELTGRLQAAPSGVTTGQLGVEFSGDLQQAIIPPLLYAGGQFRFVARITDGGTPQIELGFGTAASVGGALIKGLLELEATVRYGYTLIPETLQPAVMLGIEARAKLLAGLIGFSFSADAIARIKRVTDNAVTIWAELRVAATVQIAILIEEEIDFRTQFEQTIPLAAIGAGIGAIPLQLAVLSEVI